MVFVKNDNEAGSSSYSIPIVREDTPLLGSSHQSSKFKTLANIFIAIVGSGVLGLPYTFMKSGLNSVPTLTHLAPLSIFADVVQIGAMGVVMGKDAVVYAQNRPEVQAFGNWGVFFYLVGVCTYAFEGIGMILPLESETRDKQSFGKILGLSMGMISLLYGVFGVMGYLAFGDETRDIITTNIGKGLVSGLVQLGLCINLFFTFPLMMNPVYEVLERRFTEGRYSLWIRWLVVLVVCLVALTVPNFTDFLSLVGSSVCIALGFIFPALFHLIVFKDEMGWARLVLDCCIIVVGIILGVSGTWTSLTEIFAPKA
ncbi:hypothetical protein Cgig2_006868 [Carnegiea gigantea]|uniref:Amino acid transporter transmembrane domain-containing protein n=1 Tax=Carnegiea gigantea TaxID=171969 RepID=A0A9Q1Q4T6_9CARY|nr:hypothetical protein Cgig2_006868 [Carnegiea gigantea]